jgi:hypothetical protein
MATNLVTLHDVDFVDYAEELERPEEVHGSKGSNGTYDLSAEAYDFDKTFTPKLSKSEFEFNDAQSPVSASKYIERSLHDLDDLINLRRLELSELKRSHSLRPGSTQEYSNPLHQGKNSTSRLNSPNPVNGSDGSPNTRSDNYSYRLQPKHSLIRILFIWSTIVRYFPR